MGSQLLLIGLDAETQDSIHAAVESLGHATVACSTGVEATKLIMERTARAEPGMDLALLNRELPDMSGLTWLTMIRQTSAGKNVPVLFFGPKNSPEMEIVSAFDAGADDFIQTPCVPQELLARIRAVSRRRFDREEQYGPVLEIGPISLDPGGRQCRVRGKAVRLRPREFDILELLMRKAGRTLGRPYLLEVLWGMDKSSNTRAVDVGVSRLRQALGIRAGRWVETVERYGYRFRAPGSGL